jgi:hypothetical protein
VAAGGVQVAERVERALALAAEAFAPVAALGAAPLPAAAAFAGALAAAFLVAAPVLAGALAFAVLFPVVLAAAALVSAALEALALAEAFFVPVPALPALVLLVVFATSFLLRKTDLSTAHGARCATCATHVWTEFRYWP